MHVLSACSSAPCCSLGVACLHVCRGVAHDYSAVQVAEFGRVAIVTKASADEGCTTYAQGGVCAVLDPLDSVDKHVQDTMVAGAHLNNPQ